MEKISYLEEIYAGTAGKGKNGHFPIYSVGEKLAVRNYLDSLRHKSSEFEVNDLPFEGTEEDFLKALRTAGVEEIIVTANSTDLLRSLHALSRLGCTMIGLTTTARAENYLGEADDELIEGIRIRL